MVSNPKQLYIPILDAGHGGIKKGKYQTSGKRHYFNAEGGKPALTVYEGVINREIAQKVLLLLGANKVEYYDLNCFEQDDMSLRKRVRLINRAVRRGRRKGRKYIGYSIHSNAGGGKGFEFFTTKGETQSDKFATILFNAYKKVLSEFRYRVDTTDGDPDKELDFFILRKTLCPFVLIENLFFDNREEAEFLLSDEGQWKIAKAIFHGIYEACFGVPFQPVQLQIEPSISYPFV